MGMVKRLFVVQFWLGLSIGGLGLISLPASINASRRMIFNQTPATIEQYLGRYWTRLTRHHPQGDLIVTYTYNPAKVRRLFVDDALELAMTFVNHRLESMQIRSPKAFRLRKFGEKDYPNFYPSQFDEVFEVIFGYRPSTRSPLYGQQIADDSGDGGTLHTSTYCIEEGIAITYDWISERDLALQATFLSEPKCRSR